MTATGAFDQAMAQLRAGVEGLLAADLTALEQADLVRAITEFETERRRLEAIDQRLLQQANDSSLPPSCGQPTVAAVLQTVLRLDAREARARVNRAVDCGPRRTLTGQPLEPTLPKLAAAVAAGAVSPAQTDVIIRALERVPANAPAPAWPIAEGLLVEAATVEAPGQLARTAEALLARLDPDGIEPAEEKLERQRGFTLARHRDGSSTPRGTWTPELTALWEAILDSLAAPQPAADQPDRRTAAQRRHDAMADAALRLLRSASLPAAGGVPVTLLATTTMSDLARAGGTAPTCADGGGAAGPVAPDGGFDLEFDISGPADPSAPAAPDLGLSDLTARDGVDLASALQANSSGLAVLGHGQTISVQRLLAAACEARVVPVILNDTGGVMAYGRSRRLASTGQRLALVARDGGCSFPGCDRPAAWTEVHHIRGWVADEGPTDLENMCLVCRYHHRSHAAAGWDVLMLDGVPHWRPPAWLDPSRTPRRNTVHHLPDIVFREPSAA